MQRFDRITWNPKQMNGQPCIRGMRFTLRRVVEAVAMYPVAANQFNGEAEVGGGLSEGNALVVAGTTPWSARRPAPLPR